MAETRPAEMVARAGAPGASVSVIKCPFCQRRVDCNSRGLAGKGKRCPCGALLRTGTGGRPTATR